MSPPVVNLVSLHRREAKRRRARARRWVAGCAGYAAAALLAGAALRSQAGARRVELAAEIEAAHRRADEAETTAKALRPRIATARAELAASRAVAGQPDWSVLLALLAAERGEGLVLRTCGLAAAPPVPVSVALPPGAPGVPGAPGKPASAASPTPAPAPKLVLRVGGLGVSQTAVSEFVLRLEGTGLFDKVDLLDTAREGFLDGHAVAFRIECVLGSGKGAPGPAAGSEARPRALAAAEGTR